MGFRSTGTPACAGLYAENRASVRANDCKHRTVRSASATRFFPRPGYAVVQYSRRIGLHMESFSPHLLFRGPHAQTFATAFWPRRFPRLPPAVAREFEVEPGTRILGEYHWQSEPKNAPTLITVHGLEGSSRSGYMMGLAERAFIAGWNAVRLNLRNCGGTEHLTPTLYNSGQSGDLRTVLLELIERDSLPAIFVVGYSLGGNLVMKMAGELGSAAPGQLAGIAAVSPSLHLSECADAIAFPRNFLYQHHFVSSLKRRMRRKAQLFPGAFDLEPLAWVTTIREFDDVITARYCGFRDASDYYEKSSALRVAKNIAVPSLLISSQDDPFIPFAGFSEPGLAGNPHVEIVATKHGGHCGFISRQNGGARFWAEARVMEFFASLAKKTQSRTSAGRTLDLGSSSPRRAVRE